MRLASSQACAGSSKEALGAAVEGALLTCTHSAFEIILCVSWQPLNSSWQTQLKSSI